MAMESRAQQGFFGRWQFLHADTLFQCPDLIRGGLQLRQPNRHGCLPQNLDQPGSNLTMKSNSNYV